MFSVSDSLPGGEEEVVKPKPRPRARLLQGGATKAGGAAMLPVKEEGQDRDLKVSIVEREKVGIKSDVYIQYKVCTEVREMGNDWGGG